MAHIYWTQWGRKKVRACSGKKPITEISTVVWFNGCDIISSITAQYGISHDEYVYSHTHSIYRCLRHLQTLEVPQTFTNIRSKGTDEIFVSFCTVVNNDYSTMATFYLYFSSNLFSVISWADY